MSAREWKIRLAVAALLALHAAIALWAAANESVTHDELLHLTGGYTYWRLHDYRLHPENGILPQRWGALPAAIAHPPYPKLENNPRWSGAEAAGMGHEFFYETGHDHFPMLMAGRAMMVLFSVATGALVFAWSRRLFGLAGGFASLVLFVFSPSFLAHGPLITSDTCAAFFFLASVGAWWRHVHDGRPASWWLSAVTFGFSCVAKYSAPLLLFMFAAMMLVRAGAGAPLRFGRRSFSRPGAKLLAQLASLAGHGVVAALVIWLCYGFHYAAFNPALPGGDFVRPWVVLDLHIGFEGKVIRALAALHALPEAFLYGFAYVLETVQVRSAFLNGAYSITGWPSFFPWAFLLKTTLPVLALGVLVPVIAIHRWRARPGAWRRDLYRVTPLLALFGIYWAFSIPSHLNIGHRHILPTYPVLFIAGGALGGWLGSRRPPLLIAALALLAGQVAEAAAIAPHFLAYFNRLGGGPANGHRHLVDSSVDWGQDLPGLQRWLDAHADGAPVYLSYFGTGEPAYYHIAARRLPFVNGFKLAQPYVPLEAGWYCIGATMLEQVYGPVRGPWTVDDEKEFQQLRAAEGEFDALQRDPVRRAELLRAAPEASWTKASRRFEELRLARLCYYLRVRPADANIGYSIFLYRLTPAEVHAAADGTLLEWSRLIENTISRPPDAR